MLIMLQGVGDKQMIKTRQQGIQPGKGDSLVHWALLYSMEDVVLGVYRTIITEEHLWQ